MFHYQVSVSAELGPGDTAVDFELMGNDEEYYSYSRYPGYIFVLDFSEVHCGGCVQECIELEERIWQVYKDQGVMVYSLLHKNGVPGDEPELRDLEDWADLGLTYPVLQSNSTVRQTYYGQDLYPVSYVIDQDLVIHFREFGYDEETVDRIEEVVLDLLGGGPTVTPTEIVPPTEIPATYTPTPPFENLNLDLVMVDTDLVPNDNFYLYCQTVNDNTFIVDADFYCLLDVMGLLFWYPTWTEEFQYEQRTYDSGTLQFDILGPFPWPDVQDSLGGLHFYSVIMEKNTFDFISNLEVIPFGYGPG